MRTFSSETTNDLFSKSLGGDGEMSEGEITKMDDLLSGMILRAMEDPDFIDELPEDFDEIRSVLVAAVEHAQDRDDSPEVRACVSKKIPIIVEDHPEWSREQQIAVAFSMCRKDPKAYEKDMDVDYEEEEIQRLTADMESAERDGDAVAVAGIRYALGMAEAARDLAAMEAATKALLKAAPPKAAIQAAAAQWEEQKHPRAKGGKFAPAGAGKAPPAEEAQPKAEAKPPSQPEGAPPAPTQPTSPAGRLQQMDMDRVKAAVETARQSLAARVQEGMKKPSAPKQPGVGEATMKPGKEGYTQFEEERRAAMGDEKPKEGPKEEKPKEPEKPKPQLREEKPPTFEQFKAQKKRAKAAGIKRDQLKRFMKFPRELQDKLLQRAEQAQASRGEKGETEEYVPAGEREAREHAEKKPGKKEKKPRVDPTPELTSQPTPEQMQEIRRQAAEMKRAKESKKEPKEEKKPKKGVLVEEEEKPKKVKRRGVLIEEEPKKKKRALAPGEEPKRPEKKPEPKKEPKEKKPSRWAESGKGEPPEVKPKPGESETELDRRRVAAGRGGYARPKGYKFDENPVAIIHRSIDELLKWDEAKHPRDANGRFKGGPGRSHAKLQPKRKKKADPYGEWEKKRDRKRLASILRPDPSKQPSRPASDEPPKPEIERKPEETRTQFARREAAEWRKAGAKGLLPRPPGYHHRSEAVAVLERSLEVMLKDGTSEGAKKGWETRRRGGKGKKLDNPLTRRLAIYDEYTRMTEAARGSVHSSPKQRVKKYKALIEFLEDRKDKVPQDPARQRDFNEALGWLKDAVERAGKSKYGDSGMEARRVQDAHFNIRRIFGATSGKRWTGD